jgi:hypothetical protein
VLAQCQLEENRMLLEAVASSTALQGIAPGIAFAMLQVRRVSSWLSALRLRCCAARRCHFSIA